VTTEFAHLHVHTQYSFLASSVKVSALAKRSQELGLSAVAMTDSHSMFGAIQHYKKCRDVGVLPILGAELNVVRETGGIDHLVVLARSAQGYKNLIRLVSRGQVDSVSPEGPAVNLAQIAAHRQGLIGLTGCLGGVLSHQVLEFGEAAGRSMLGRLADCFEPDHLFVELQNHGFPEQAVVNSILAKAAKDQGLPVVATNDVHFMNRQDAKAQLVLECVGRGRTYAEALPTHHGSSEMYLKSGEEMAQAFADHPEAVSNTLRVAEMCRDLRLELGQPMLPNFPVPEGHTSSSYFRQVARDGLIARFAQHERAGQSVDADKYRNRLEIELDVIESMGFAGYFLVVWDFIREAKERGIPVGPGRGSGAGSLVAYAMRITDLDPLPYDLLFERFLNPERVSMPDFDIDFCMDRREEVIEYVAAKYGRESVGQIATFQNLKARSVIKDVARAMGMAAPDAQRIASLIPDKGQGQTYTIAEALVVEPKLKALVDSSEEIAELMDQSQRLEGLTRHAGMHAAGVVISDGPLDDHVPIFKSDQALVTQYDKSDVEDAGLVKFDFLGLKTLTVIDVAERLVNARPDRRDRPLRIADLPLDDRATYQLISSGETTGVFQLESSGMQQLLRQLRPDCFEDIVAVVALYRPGPLGTGMVEDFVLTKHGRKETRKLHPLIDEVLAPTYGVPVYQEQVMQIAQRLAGYSLGGADLLRRAMGKKKAEEMQKQKQAFIEGAASKGVPGEKAEAIFNEIEGFASYGFNKSHSAGYALVTYQTAYLKAHYPTEFFAAALTADREKIEKVVRTIAEARAWGVLVLPPDINASRNDFTVVYQYPAGDGPTRAKGKLKDPYGPRIRFGMGAIRGVGESALEAVFEARDRDGKFKDLFDFATRVDSRRLNRGLLEALVSCGAFDSVLEPLKIHRASAFAAVERCLERGRSATRDREAGQATLFGLFANHPQVLEASVSGKEYPEVEAWDRLELLAREKAALGCYVSGHPLFRYGSQVGRVGALQSDQLAAAPAWSQAAVAGVVENYQERVFKRGGSGKVAFFELEDAHGRVKAKLRGDRIDAFGHLLKGGEPLLVRGKVSLPVSDDSGDEGEPVLFVDSVEPLSAAVLSASKRLLLKVSVERTEATQFSALAALLRGAAGEIPVELTLGFESGAMVHCQLPQRVALTDRLLGQIERALGDATFELG
jgi:DNA polymerase-3 subunit alpha